MNALRRRLILTELKRGVSAELAFWESQVECISVVEFFAVNLHIIDSDSYFSL